VIALPRALAPWAPELSLFPEELALSLGPWVQRLALAVGPLRAHSSQGRDEPDGYDGLASRGSYERLLPSEWLLADEAPDEFLRRAAMREHAFLKLSFQEAAGARRSVALFDAGPDQLGSPRLAHLAALIALARRAERAGASFRWGILQHAGGGLMAEVTAASVLQLLRARTAFDVGEKNLLRWREELGAPGAPDDLWLIGGRRLARAAASAGGSLLEVEDVLEPRASQVSVSVRRGSLRGRPVMLELPPSRDCARLLRDPFNVVRARPLRIAAALGGATHLLFAPSGRRLFAQQPDGKVIVYGVPNSPRAGAGTPKVRAAPAGARIIAAGWCQRRPLFVSWDPEAEQLTVQGLPGKSSVVRKRLARDTSLRPPTPGDRLAPCFAINRQPTHPNGVVFLDSNGGLFWVSEDVEEVLRLGASTTAAALVQDALVYVQGALPDPERDDLAPRRIRRLREGVPAPLAVDLSGDGDLSAFFGFGEHPDVGLLAVRCRADRWRVIHALGMLDLIPPRGTTVVGVAMAKAEAPALVVLEENRRVLSLLGMNECTSLPPASTEIAHACASSTGPEVAYVTLGGEVVVYSLSYRAVIMRALPGRLP
jgi:hypothetical protein